MKTTTIEEFFFFWTHISDTCQNIKTECERKLQSLNVPRIRMTRLYLIYSYHTNDFLFGWKRENVCNVTHYWCFHSVLLFFSLEKDNNTAQDQIQFSIMFLVNSTEYLPLFLFHLQRDLPSSSEFLKLQEFSVLIANKGDNIIFCFVRNQCYYY